MGGQRCSFAPCIEIWGGAFSPCPIACPTPARDFPHSHPSMLSASRSQRPWRLDQDPQTNRMATSLTTAHREIHSRQICMRTCSRFVCTRCSIVYAVRDHSWAFHAVGFKVIMAGKLPAQLMILNDPSVWERNTLSHEFTWPLYVYRMTIAREAWKRKTDYRSSSPAHRFGYILTPSLPTPSIVGVQFLLAAAQPLL